MCALAALCSNAILLASRGGTMKLPVAIAIVMFAVPGTALAQDFSQRVGDWNVSGSGGDCAMSAGSAEGMIMFASPASGGENEGGLALAGPDSWNVVAGRAVIRYGGPGAWAGEHPSMGTPEFNGYWTALESRTQLDAFPDSWQVKAWKDGTLLVDFPVKGFKAALQALRSCAEQTK